MLLSRRIIIEILSGFIDNIEYRTQSEFYCVIEFWKIEYFCCRNVMVISSVLLDGF